MPFSIHYCSYGHTMAHADLMADMVSCVSIRIPNGSDGTYGGRMDP